MELSEEIRTLGKLASGLSWTLVYILLITKGFRQKTFGMPLVALCANLSWEFIFSFVLPHKAPQLYVNYVWLTFDVIIAYQFIKYGRKQCDVRLPQKGFWIWCSGILALSYMAVLFITLEFEDRHGMYAAFSQNLMMSILFLSFLNQRPDHKGQSLWAAILKMVGTMIPSFLFWAKYPNSPLLLYLFCSIFLFDAIYVWRLWRKKA